MKPEGLRPLSPLLRAASSVEDGWMECTSVRLQGVQA